MEENEGISLKPTWNDITHSQSMALAISCKVSSFVSIVGSSIVIYQIIAPKKRKAMLKTMYNRIILTISTMDVIGSLAMFMSTWPIPKDTIHDDWIWGNIGNQTTCNIQGYFIQSSVLSVSICTSFLCIYFMLLIRYNWSERRLRKMELMMRGAICLVFICSTIPLLTEAYNPTLFACWIQSYPIDCDTSDEYECLRGENTENLRKIFVTTPICSCVLIITITMSLLYISVREQEKSVSRYRVSYRSESLSSSRTRRVFIKAALFIGSFCLIWIPSTIGNSLQRRGNIYHIVVPFWISIFVPLQGLCNAIIYNYENIANADIRRSRPYLWVSRSISLGSIIWAGNSGDESSDDNSLIQEIYVNQTINGVEARTYIGEQNSMSDVNRSRSQGSALNDSISRSRKLSLDSVVRLTHSFENNTKPSNEFSDNEIGSANKKSLKMSLDRSQYLESILIEPVPDS